MKCLSYFLDKTIKSPYICPRETINNNPLQHAHEKPSYFLPECQSVYVDSLLTHENYIRSTNLTFHYTPAFCSFSSGEYDIFRNEAEGITTLEKR